MWRKIAGLVCCFCIIFTLCGCDFITADTAELLSPPSLSGDIKPIAAVINDTAPAGYTMKYPSRGDFRSAVIREDIDSDGLLEAFAFYSVTDGEVITMHMNFISNKDGKWSSVAVGQIVAAGVDKVEFSDLDGDGVEEIIVGWQIYGTSEMQFGVYSIGENSVTQRMLQKYTHFTVCDLDEDNRNEVFVIKVSSNEANTASVHSINENGVTELSSCIIDKSATTVNEPVLDTLSTGKPAVYIDIIKGVGAVTEVMFMEKGKLVNPLIDPEVGETVSTLRSISFGTEDINDDGILEIPVQMEVPSVTRSDVLEKLYLTNWCSFNGEVLTNQMTTMINVNDGYYFILSSKWVGNIAVLKDTTNRIREIYIYNTEEMTVGSSVLYLRAIKKKEWDSGRFRDEGFSEITDDGQTVFVCKISETGIKQGIDMEYVKSNFKLLDN